MPRLDERLRRVAQCVRARTHADIGADHGNLIRALLASGRIRRGIAIDNKHAPLANARATLAADIAAGQAVVRFADGLAGLHANEADSLSICGMGATSIITILMTDPARVPASLVVQPNDHPEWIRQWAIDQGFHLVGDHITAGHRPFSVLQLQRADAADPAYAPHIDRDLAIAFGPFAMRDGSVETRQRLLAERDYWRRPTQLEPKSQARLDLIERALATLER